MPLQDLTPQLRTRLRRVERAVGFFVTVATILLVLGFVYYIYHTAKRKGWFLTKIVYQTSLNNAAGLKPGDPVKLMGFNVGEILEVKPNDPGAWYGVTVFFRILDPNFGYIWLDSKVRVAAADFLGNRSLEILKGMEGEPTVLLKTKPLLVLDNDAVDQKFKELVAKIKKENSGYTEHAAKIDATNEINQLIKANQAKFYVPLKSAKAYWIEPLESPALTERLETFVTGLESALPNILQLTNQLTGVLTNAEDATAQLKGVLADARPAVTNLTLITANLTNANGSLGDWLLPTNLAAQLQLTLESAKTTLDTANETLGTANGTLAHTDTNVTSLVSNLNLSLISLADLTSNLNSQVQVNSNIVKQVSDAIVHTDELVQGLKRHWLLRSAFKTNKVEKGRAPQTQKRMTSPREAR